VWYPLVPEASCRPLGVESYHRQAAESHHPVPAAVYPQPEEVECHQQEEVSYPLVPEASCRPLGVESYHRQAAESHHPVPEASCRQQEEV